MFDKEKIGNHAGVIWRLMAASPDHRYWTVKQLALETQLSEDDVCAAVGWLAREDKIEFETDNAHEETSLFLNLGYYF